MSDETKRLIEAAQSGDEAAAETLVKENTGLIYSAVRRFHGRGAEDEDLFQIGSIGLIKAVRRFDGRYNVELSTYAVPLIIGEIRRFLRDDGMIKVSRGAREAAAKIRKMGDVGIDEAAQKLGISREEAVFALEATAELRSIDKMLYEKDGVGVSLADTLATEDTEEERVERMELKRAVGRLSESDRAIVALRFYRELTQSKTAAVMGMSQVQVSRREKKILARLREEMGSN
ncbi:MAG: sigma-70 family RNA polymerase sigma factor [Clostridia bacterium]|nr:sigma-70 family RNA polymerase sigma factor [Clostridia bacterium]